MKRQKKKEKQIFNGKKWLYEEEQMDKIHALEYLIENSVYGNEWQGAGMYEIIVKMMKYQGIIKQKYLNRLLKEAEDR